MPRSDGERAVEHDPLVERQRAAREDQVEVVAAVRAAAEAEMQARMAFLEAGVAAA